MTQLFPITNFDSLLFLNFQFLCKKSIYGWILAQLMPKYWTDRDNIKLLIR